MWGGTPGPRPAPWPAFPTMRKLFLFSVLLLAGCRSHNPLALQPLPQFESDFTHASAHTRILLLISPT